MLLCEFTLVPFIKRLLDKWSLRFRVVDPRRRSTGEVLTRLTLLSLLTGQSWSCRSRQMILRTLTAFHCEPCERYAVAAKDATEFVPSDLLTGSWAPNEIAQHIDRLSAHREKDRKVVPFRFRPSFFAKRVQALQGSTMTWEEMTWDETKYQAEDRHV